MAIYKLVTDHLLKCLKDAVKKIQCMVGSPNGIATLDDTGNVPADQLANAGGGGGAVSSVFTRTGDVVAATNDYTFAQIGTKPTTLIGYGITDAITGGGSTTQYIRGDGSKVTFPTTVSSFTNDSAYVAATPLRGSIYNKSTWANTTDFTTNGATVSIVSNKIRFTGGANTYTQLLSLNGNTALEYWKVTAEISVDEITTTSFGFGIGVSSTNTIAAQKVSNIGRVAYTTATNGTIGIGNQTNTTYADIATKTTTSVSANDHVLLTLERIQNNLTVTVRNLTTSSAETSISYSYQFITGAPILHNTGLFSIWSVGGQFTLQSLTISSDEQVGTDLLIIGDSKSIGYYASDWNNRFGSLLKDYYRVAVHAGGSDKTTEVLQAMTEIISLSPKKVLMCIGSNDIRFGLTEGQFETNYASISSQLITAGVDVYYALPFFETAEDQSTQKTYIQTTYPTGKVIDTYTATNILGGLAADGTHPNTLGHYRIFKALIDSFQIPNALIRRPNVSTGNVDIFLPTNTAVNQKLWNVNADSNNFYIDTLNDDRTLGQHAMLITRSNGNGTITGINFPWVAPIFIGSGTSAGSSYTLQVNSASSQTPFYLNTTAATGAWMVYAISGTVKAYVGIGALSTSPATANDFSIRNDKVYLSAFGTGAPNIFFDVANKKIGIGVTTLTGQLHIAAGTATAGTAPVKLVAGTNLTTAEDGAIEYDGSNYYHTVGTTRYPIGKFMKMRTTVSSATTLTLDLTSVLWVFSGSSTTVWTLPAITGNTEVIYRIKNRGSATITLQRAGSDNLYTTSSVTTLTINPGEGYEIINDGSFWLVL